MTTRNVTGFCAFFSTRKAGNFSTLWGDFDTKFHGEKGESPVEKIQKNPVQTAHRNCRFSVPCRSRMCPEKRPPRESLGRLEDKRCNPDGLLLWSKESFSAQTCLLSPRCPCPSRDLLVISLARIIPKLGCQNCPNFRKLVSKFRNICFGGGGGGVKN